MLPAEKRLSFFMILLPALIFGGMLAALQPIGNATFDWHSWRPATCMPDGCFCEAVRTTGIRQPSNAWSSLAFVFVSLLVVGHTLTVRSRNRIAPQNAMEKSAVYPMTFVLALLLVGFGSAFYHMSLTFAGQFFDVFGMYLIATFILVYNIGRLRPVSAIVTVSAFVLVNIVLATLLYEIPLLRRFMFAVVLLTALAVEIPIRKNSQPVLNGKFLWSAIAILAIGFAIWILDITKVLCMPGGTLQGHAVWHVAGAASSLLLYFYYCSEQSAVPAA